LEMIAPIRMKTLPLLLCSIVLVSCADQPQTGPRKKLRLETIKRADSDTLIYLYREEPADR
jgi:hypothetical protein